MKVEKKELTVKQLIEYITIFIAGLGIIGLALSPLLLIWMWIV